MGKETTDSPLESPVGEGLPKPVIGSAVSGGEPSSTSLTTLDDASLTKLAELLAPRMVEAISPQVRETLRPDVERVVQSTKDVRWKIFADLDPADIKLVADTLKANADDPVRAADSLALKALLEERKSQAGPASTAATVQPTSPNDPGRSVVELKDEDVRRVLGTVELSVEQQKAVFDQWSVVTTYQSNQQALEGLELIARRAKAGVAAVPSSAAGIVTPTGSTISLTDNEKMATIDRLYGELNEFMRNPSENREVIKATKVKLREFGETNI